MIPKINRILYTTGLGSGAPYVFRYALCLAQAHQAKIYVVNAIEPLSTFGQSLVELHISHSQSEQMHQQAQQTVKNNLLTRARKLCEKESANTPGGMNLVEDISVVEGKADQVILARAQEIDADVIIMGTQRHSIVEKALAGSTARNVMHHSQIPVLFIRIPEGFFEKDFES